MSVGWSLGELIACSSALCRHCCADKKIVFKGRSAVRVFRAVSFYHYCCLSFNLQIYLSNPPPCAILWKNKIISSWLTQKWDCVCMYVGEGPAETVRQNQVTCSWSLYWSSVAESQITPKHSNLTQQTLSHTVSTGQWSRSSLAAWFRLWSFVRLQPDCPPVPWESEDSIRAGGSAYKPSRVVVANLSCLLASFPGHTGLSLVLLMVWQVASLRAGNQNGSCRLL